MAEIISLRILLLKLPLSLYTFFPVNMKTALAITRTLSRRYYPLHPEEQEALASIMECRRVDKGELLLEEGRIARHFPL